MSGLKKRILFQMMCAHGKNLVFFLVSLKIMFGSFNVLQSQVLCFLKYPKIWGQIGTLSKLENDFYSIQFGGVGNAKNSFKSMIFSKHWGQKYLTFPCTLHLGQSWRENCTGRCKGVASTPMLPCLSIWPLHIVPRSVAFALVSTATWPSNWGPLAVVTQCLFQKMLEGVEWGKKVSESNHTLRESQHFECPKTLHFEVLDF